MIRVDESTHGERGLEQLREILRGYPGGKKLQLRLDLASGGKVLLDSGWQGVDLNAELRERVEALLGPGSFAVQAAPRTRQAVATGGNGRTRREPARART